jgi:dienelactone hydrolase
MTEYFFMSSRPLASRRTVLGALGAAIAGPAVAQATDRQLPSGLVGEFHAGVGKGRRPAVLVLGGSEGGVATASAFSKLMAAEGYATLGLGYFRAPGLPDALENIPLEYFVRGVDWLAARPGVDPRRIGILGGSKGGEAALLLASHEPRLKAVVACVPSSVVWAGVDMANQAHMLTIGSSWSWKGQPLPYARYDFSGFKTIRGMYDKSLQKAPPDAVIPVEKINGPVLLVSGGRDEFWPSTPMCEAVIARLDAAKVRHRHVHLSYAEGGHGIFGPPQASIPGLTPSAQFLATQAARADSWPKTLAFLKEALKP